MAEQWPSAGRIVHTAGHQAAVITEVFGTGSQATVNLFVFPTPTWPEGEVIAADETWHWPEYVGPASPEPVA